MSHPHICQIFEAGEEEGEPDLVMELIKGESLAARLERGALPPAEALGVDGLKVRLSPREERVLGHDVPASAGAYEKYLRANRLTLADTGAVREAQALYEACVTEDPSYAPAWARLGRLYRIRGKYAWAGERGDGAPGRRGLQEGLRAESRPAPGAQHQDQLRGGEPGA